MAKVFCFLLLAVGGAWTVRAGEPAVDAAGTRILANVPPPGVHPRVFLTAAELPALRARWQDPVFAATIGTALRGTVRGNRRQLEAFAALDCQAPTADILERYWRGDEGRNIRWGVTAVQAVVDDDQELKALMIKVITNYSQLILASRELKFGDVDGRTGLELNKRFNVWESDSFDLAVGWVFGGAGMALSYDLLFNDMTVDQRALVRAAIAAGTAGRRSYGMDEPRGKAISNHYGYHGDLAVMLAAIEGEEGYDHATYKRIEQVLTDYFTIGFTPDGACHEDTYGPNLGMREGSRGLLVLARRGRNLFATPHYRNFVNWMAQSIEPFPGGVMIGGASGASDRLYPTSQIVAKYMRPRDPAADFVYRWCVGDRYDANLRWQGLLDYALFGMAYNSDPESAPTLAHAGLPLSDFYDRRGKLITRSDWSPNALYFHFDARPDAFSIGHDTVDRGTFVLSALGRPWAIHPSWHHFRESRDYSLVHVDGQAQAWKAPSVKFLGWHDGGDVVTGNADLKYAYDWQWSPPWPHETDTFAPPWEHETRDPRDLGWPDDPAWLPHTLYGTPAVGYVGSYMWRCPYNPVRVAQRATALVRGETPFVIVADRVKKDDAVHDYAWYMQVAGDLQLEPLPEGRGAILRGVDPADDRRLLVRTLRPQPLAVTLDSYQVATARDGTPIMGNRLILTRREVAGDFRIMLMPYHQGTALPTVSSKDENHATIRVGDRDCSLSFPTQPALSIQCQSQDMGL